MPLAVALLSGGLDSQLAIRVMQEQGVSIHALNFQTIFTCCERTAAQAAIDLNVPLTVISQADDYLDLIKRPKFGYGRGANPCVDCRIYMFRRAAEFLRQIGGDFVISGEVVGQRPMSQKKRDLAVIARHSGLESRLLRPLSARLLPPTLPECNGMVDRSRLYEFSGRSRKGLIALAHQLGIQEIPSPSTGCTLTEPGFAGKVHDLVQLDPASGRWDFELLKVGRHFRFDASTKIVLGRNEQENAALERMFEQPSASAAAMMTPDGFTGPAVLVIGEVNESALDFAGALLRRYARHDLPADVPARAWLTLCGECERRMHEIKPADETQAAACAAAL